MLNDIQNSNTSRNLPVKSTSLSHMNVYIFASFLAVKTPVRTSTTTFPHTSSQDAVIYCDLDNFHSSSLPELFTLIVAHKMEMSSHYSNPKYLNNKLREENYPASLENEYINTNAPPSNTFGLILLIGQYCLQMLECQFVSKKRTWNVCAGSCQP